VQCDADLTDSKSEIKLLEDTHNALYSLVDKTMSPGWEAYVYLTNKRLIVVPAKMRGSGLDGRLAAVVYNKITSKSGLVSIPLTDITAVRDGKMGLLMKALIVDVADGELVKIKVGGREKWREAITEAIK